jgi:hypothetical protein
MMLSARLLQALHAGNLIMLLLMLPALFCTVLLLTDYLLPTIHRNVYY